MSRWRDFVYRVKQEAQVYRRVARWLLGLALAYLLSPVDIIPDFLPVLGYLDDVLLVPGLVYLALRMIPPAVVAEAREQAPGGP